MATYRVESGTEGTHVHLFGKHAGKVHRQEFWCLPSEWFLIREVVVVGVEDLACYRMRADMGQCGVSVFLDANNGLELKVSKTESEQGGSHRVHVTMHYAMNMKMCEGHCDWDHLHRGKYFQIRASKQNVALPEQA